MMRSKAEVKKWVKKYEPFGLNIQTVQPSGKLLYPDIPWQKGFRAGANICSNHNPLPDGNVHDVSVDVDTRKVPRLMKRLLGQTVSWLSPSGFGALFSGPVAPEWVKPLRAVRMNRIVRDKIGWTWNRIDPEDFERGKQIEKRLFSLGVTDSFGIHQLFPDLDGFTFILLVPSRSCIYQKNIVRLHSTDLPYCNKSPDHKHYFFTRKFLNYQNELMPMNEFLEEVMR